MLEIKAIKDLMMIKSLWEAMNRHNMIHSRHFQNDYREQTFESYINKFEQFDDYRLEVVYQDSKPYGYILGHVNNSQAQIDSFYIYDDLRGMGLGEYIMNRMIVWFNSTSAEAIILEVEAGNESVVTYFQKMGFYTAKYTMKLGEE